MTLDDLNGRDQRGFVDAVGWVFEESPWVAERTWASRPFGSVEALHRAMAAQVARAAYDEQLALLRAHPDLGGRVGMSDVSTAEQAGAGLKSLTPLEFTQLTTLNAAYREKFGFPFLYAVRGSSKSDVLMALDRRLRSSPEIEFNEALRQVDQIARFRLGDLFRSEQP